MSLPGDWNEYGRLVLSELKRLNEDSKDAKKHHELTNKLLAEYNSQLELHIAGVKTLDEKTDLLKDEINSFKTSTNKRLEVAELPIKWARTSSRVFLLGSPIIGALYAIYKFILKL